MKIRHLAHLRRISKRTLKTLAYILGIVIGILLIFSSWLYFQEAKVKEILIRELNKRLVTEVKVSDVQFSILKSFPYTSIDFINPQAKGAHPSDPEYLFKAKRISLHFNIMDIYYGRYDIKRIEIQGGFFNLKCYKNNDFNFHIWKDIPLDNSNFRFSLNKIIGKNVKVRYRDLDANYDYTAYLSRLTAKGNFDQSEQTIWVKGKYSDCLLQQRNFVFLKNKKGDLHLSLQNNVKTKTCVISEGQLSVNGLDFTVKGQVQYNQNYLLNLQIQGMQLSLKNFIAAIPQQEQSYFTDYKCKGILDFSLQIKGNFHIPNGLGMQADFLCKEAEIAHKPSNTVLSHIHIQGSYNNGLAHTLASSNLYLKNFSASLPSGQISSRLQIHNFVQPTLKSEAKIKANLEELNTFLGFKQQFLCAGDLDLALSYQNTFSSLDLSKIKKEDFLYSQCQGSVRIQNFNFYIEKPVSYSVQCPELNFEFTNQNVDLTYTRFKINRQELNLSAHFTNLFPAIFMKDQKLQIEADIKAQRLDASLLIPSISKDNKKEKTEKTEESAMAALGLPFLLENLSLDAQLSIDHLLYAGIDYQNLQTHIVANAEKYKLSPFRVDLFDGSTQGNIDFRRLSPDRFLVNLDIKNTNVNIKHLLQAFNNFGQTQCTWEQISGILNNEMQFSAIYDLKLGMNLSSILLWTKLNISQGQLRNAEILKLLAKYTGEKDLHSINFADLNNSIEIKDAIISIPEMSIFSNALNLKLSGEHHFNNNVNYIIKIELSELLSRRRKARNAKNKDEEFGVVEASNPSVIVLPIRITGNLRDPKISYDIRTAKQLLSSSQQKEKENVKQLLKEEFESLKNTENQADKKAWKEQEKGKFKIHWDEEQTQSQTTPSKEINTPKETKKESAKFKIEFDTE